MNKFVLIAILAICCNGLYAQPGTRVYKIADSTFGFDAYWRRLMAQGKYEEAAKILEFDVKASRRRDVNRHSFYWHAGQLRAMAGQYKKAKRDMRKTHSIFYKLGGEDAKTWYYYAKGTEAFLDGDKKRLVAIIKKWEKRYTRDKNYENLLRLLDSWGKTYAQANGM